MHLWEKEYKKFGDFFGAEIDEFDAQVLSKLERFYVNDK